MDLESQPDALHQIEPGPLWSANDSTLSHRIPQCPMSALADASPANLAGSDASSQPHMRRPFGLEKETLKTVGLVVMWWSLNILYNIDNKKALMMLPLPITVATIQLFIGFLWFVPLWLFEYRPKPSFHTTRGFVTKLLPQGVFHCLVHLSAVMSFGAGSVSFTHIVKAGEPVVTAVVAAVACGEVHHPMTYLSLLPIVGGVSLASLGELSFNWYSFWAAMLSNVASSFRAIFAKNVMSNTKEVGLNLDVSNQYYVLTVIAAIVAVPWALIAEGSLIAPIWADATAADAPHSAESIGLTVLLSGIWYFAYNEVAFRVLERVAPISHAVGNTLKRVFIIIAALIVFQNPITLFGSAGSCVAILGTLLYSLTKQKFK